MSLSKEVTKALKNTGYLPDINGEASASSSSTSSTVETSNPEESSGSTPAMDEPQPGPSGVSNPGSASGKLISRKKEKNKMLNMIKYLIPFF